MFQLKLETIIRPITIYMCVCMLVCIHRGDGSHSHSSVYVMTVSSLCILIKLMLAYILI